MSILGALVGIVYKSLFTTGDTGFRTAHPLSKLAFTISAVSTIVLAPHLSPFLAPVVIVLGLLHPGFYWVVAVSTLSGLVGLYMGSSAYLLSLLGLYYMHPQSILVIAARTFSISVVAVFIFTVISPLEVYNLLLVLGVRHYSNYPILVWRLTPQALRYFMESLSVGLLKRERATRRIPAAVASAIELAWFIEEYCYWRLRVKPKYTVHLDRSAEYTLVLLLASLVIAFLLKILYT